MLELNERTKRRICGLLKEYDPGIVEIVQFGSSVYAPKYAKDLDLLLITKEKKGYGGYLDCLEDFDPRFKEAKSYIRGAKEDLEMAMRSENEDDKDRRIRTAFNSLFHAARLAAMTSLSTENARWGRIKRRLP